MRLRFSIADAGFIFNLVGQQRRRHREVLAAVARQAKLAAEIRLSNIVSQLDQPIPIAL